MFTSEFRVVLAKRECFHEVSLDGDGGRGGDRRGGVRAVLCGGMIRPALQRQGFGWLDRGHERLPGRERRDLLHQGDWRQAPD